MKEWLHRQFSRIDALGLRERVLLLLSVVVCFLAAADTVWLSPSQIAQKKLVFAVKRESAELETLRMQLRTSSQPPRGSDPAQTERDQIVQTKMRIEEVNRGIAQASSLTDKTNSLPKVLVHFLRRHDQLTLVRMSTLAGDSQVAKQPQTAGSASLPSIRRQGMELTVSGPYLELMNYVGTLEQALPALRWGSMRLGSEKLPPQLTLQVLLLEVQP